ncbi:hypothetical protein [Streptomyces sp. CT34]|uniref:hypothetical protein n=1 Tax=Streptomyces sp. CT34 TaxID=1553907 RepID=UPI0005BBAF60|nr:hypothetical protein [Streptomyces sp. CT34]
MLHTKTAWLRAAAPVAVLAMTLTACGGHKGASNGAVGPSPDQQKSSADSAPKTDKNSTAPAAGNALKPGQSGTGQYKEESGKVTYEVAAQKVHVGTEAEAQKMVRDPKDAKGLVAAIAFVKYTNKGPGIIKGLAKADVGAEIYADGRRGGVLIGAPHKLPGCEDPVDIDNWKVGQSHVLCTTYMIPKGAKALEVHWGDEGVANPLIWKFDNAG